jgi:chemotaxis family two-component system sensor kinase Cph1
MFGNEKLIGMHLVADLAIGIAYVVIGYDLIMIYRAFKNYHLPWKGYLWMYGGFILLCGLTHWFGVLNLWVTYYWLDGLVKMATAIFSASVAVVFHADSKNMRKMKSSQEYERLAIAYEKLLKQYEEIKDLHALDRN